MIRVEALGGFRVVRDDLDLASLPAKPQRAALLAYLAVERETSRQRLCFLLWPDSSPERARRSLSQTLYELRQELGDGWMESAGDRVNATEQLSADVVRLRAAASEGRELEVIDVYRGPFLDGVLLGGGVEFERWVEDTRSQIHGMVKRHFRSVVEGATDAERRARLARAWVQLDPLDDEGQHALIESLATAGDRSGALEQYRIYSELIAAELEVAPLEHTVELVERIKSGRIGPAEGEPPSRHDETREADGEGDATAIQIEPGLIVSRLIGRGATGSVYLAREPALKRLVAVKVLDAKLASNPTARARFEREAQSAARIGHPNVAVVHRVGTTEDGRPYLVMPYVKGGTLADRMKALGPLPPGEVRRLLAEAASALAAAHEVGVIHRDVRPANLLYDEQTGRTYLADFGIAGVLESGTAEIAQLTRTGELLGNAEYISPEQARGEEVDDRSDVYSVGILGRALLLGDATSGRAADECPDRELIQILERATRKEARHRPAAAELAAALEGKRPLEASGGWGGLRGLTGWLRRS